MKKILKRSLLVLVVLIFAYTIFFLFQKSRKKPVIYTIEMPFKTNIVNKTVATGKVVPRKEIEIKPRVSGIVSELFVEPGDIVRIGTPLARIKIVPDMISLNNAESRVEKAKISLDDAQRVYDRQKQLFDQQVIAIAELEKAEILLKNSKAEYQASEDYLKLIREGVSSRSKEQTNTLVTSTIEGMVLTVPIEVGNSVIESNNFNPGTTIAVIANMSEMIFMGKVDEVEVGKLSLGMNLTLTIGAITDTKFDAKLEYIAPKGVEESGAIKFEIRAEMKLKEDFFVRSGYSATAEIVLEQKDSIMAVKESLLNFSEKSDSIYVEVLIDDDPQTFEKRYVKIGLSDGINTEILEGLSIEDKIKGAVKRESSDIDSTKKM
ncbi:MAG TPA: efflux RND transporter periplasmic adaptor subunit [Salinivirgaceae bacterium]|nr:efflux RND transporter periplasmic adaptor subunit [Salinivirgaceae bacterium]HQA76561.1 efflux RND transporter periplasmic adaptor subunit [Salinivirgaceae bacterium]